MRIRIEKRELQYAVIGLIVIIAWFIYIRPMIAAQLEQLPPIIAMLVYNSGMFIGLYFLTSPLNGKKVKFKATTITFLLILGIDILYAPYLVQGNGMISTDVELWYVSTDAAFGDWYGGFVPQNMIWFMTYIVTSAFLLLIFPVILLNPRQIARYFGH